MPKTPLTLSVYLMAGDRARLVKATTLTCDIGSALCALENVRRALPPDCAASLTDAEGRNVRRYVPRQSYQRG